LILAAASAMYGAAATWRRRWYARNPGRRARLSRPVVSVGNLRAGGSGKTPTVAYLAALLLAHGERPAILTRGYARKVETPDVTVVSDGAKVLAGLDESGDEPLMLARALPGVPVLVGRMRQASGRLAEARFGTTVHLLDDGFQHLALARDVDLLLVSEDDLTDRVLPAGRLREPLTSAAAADAVIVSASAEEGVERVRRALGISSAFRLHRKIGGPRIVGRDAGRASADIKPPFFAVAGIARPERFFGDLADAGWQLAGTMTFGDHHQFTDADLARIAGAARAAGAATVVTTEKDGVRLEGRSTLDVPLGVVPVTVTIEPSDGFATWLLDRLKRARQPARGTRH
jgi:tetraacyldisaccharide 4'-kinase